MGPENIFVWKDWKSEAKLKSYPERQYLKDIVHLKFTRGKDTPQYKDSCKESVGFKELDFLQPRVLKKGIPEPVSLGQPKGFPSGKKDQLLQSLKNIIPENRKMFWERLPIC